MRVITEKILRRKIGIMNNLMFGYTEENHPKYGEKPMFMIENTQYYGYRVVCTCEGSNGTFTCTENISPSGTKPQVYYWIEMWINGFQSAKTNEVQRY